MPAVNVVEVDAAALDREADQVLRGAPPRGPSIEGAPNAGEQPSGAEKVEGGSWSDITPGLVTVLTFAVFPQWDISHEEQAEVSKALADVLEQVFPGGMGNKRWAPWIRLGMVGSGVVLARFHPEYGFPPLGPRREKRVGPGAEPPSSSGSSSSNDTAAAEQAH